MRQRLLWYVLITINFKNLKKERKGGKNGEEGKGGGRKERKEVNRIPRADDFEREGARVHGSALDQCPSRSTSLGFADEPVLWGGLCVQRVTHLQDSTHHQSSLGFGAWPVCGGAGGQINGVSCKLIHVPKASTGKSTREKLRYRSLDFTVGRNAVELAIPISPG